jgi:amino acid transporter
MALTIATSIFIKTFLTSIGVTTAIPNTLLYFLVSVGIWVFACRDIKISARIGLTLEVISVAIILFVCVYMFAHFGFKIDPKQVSLEGIDLKSAAQACVLAIFSFVGFESSATLGRETRNATTSIPKAIVGTVIFAGVFFTLTTYLIVQGFEDDATKLGASSAPLADITTNISVSLTALVYFGAAISAFACALASLNAYGRMLFSLGRYQFVHQTMGLVHKDYKTPYVALTVGTVMNFIVCAAFAGQAETDTFGWYGTIASFGFIVVYFLCSLAAPVFLAKNGGATTGDKILGGLGALFMVLSLIGSVYPVPAAPYNYFPYFFLVYMLLGVTWFFILKARVPQALLGIEHDLETSTSPAE